MAKAKGGATTARKGGRRRKKSARQIANEAARAEHIQMALDYRRRGYNYREIAAALSASKDEGGIGKSVAHSTVHAWVTKALDEAIQASANQVLNLELERLDEMMSAVYGPIAEARMNNAPPPPGSITQVLAIMDRRAKYLGLYKSEDAAGETARGVDTLAAMIAADKPVLRPDGPLPANPIL
jgi:hypothetical protein